MKTLRIVIHGRVQGVGFRFSLADLALQLGVDGWVRNRRDGTVEALLHGPEPAVDALHDWARRGPPGARVSEVVVHTATADDAAALARGFVSLPTL